MNPHKSIDDIIDRLGAESVAQLVAFHPRLTDHLIALLKYKVSNPNRYFMQALANLEDDFSVDSLLRVIHQQDESIAFLSHQLVHYDSLSKKYDKLATKVDFLKRQNKRLLDRNNNLVSGVHKSKNHR